MPNDDRALLTLAEIAAETRVPLATLRWYRANGKGPKTFRVGARIVARRGDIDAWVNAQELASGVGATSAVVAPAVAAAVA